MTTPGRPAWLTMPTTVFVVFVVFFAVATPVAIALDSRIDRTRPMNDDRGEMLWLQYRSVLTTGQSVPGEVTAEESVEIAGETFTPSPGVRVEVRADEATRPCVRASNEHDDVTEWACLDPDAPPADPDPEDADLGVG